MGNEVIKKGLFHRIDEGEKFWAAISSRVFFLSKSTGRMVWSPKGIRYPSKVLFVDEGQALIKCSDGKYYLYDILSKECLKVFADRRIRKTGQDHCPVYDPNTSIMYDIIDIDLYEQYVIRLDLMCGEFSFSKIPFEGRARNWAGFRSSNYTFVHNCTHVGFKEAIVAYTRDGYKFISTIFPNSDTANIVYFDSQITLYADGQIKLNDAGTDIVVDLPSDTITSLRSCSVVKKMNSILCVYSNRIELRDICNKDRIYTYMCDDIYDAKIIDNYICIATGHDLRTIDIDNAFLRL